MPRPYYDLTAYEYDQFNVDVRDPAGERYIAPIGFVIVSVANHHAERRWTFDETKPTLMAYEGRAV